MEINEIRPIFVRAMSVMSQLGWVGDETRVL